MHIYTNTKENTKERKKSVLIDHWKALDVEMIRSLCHSSREVVFVSPFSP